MPTSTTSCLYYGAALTQPPETTTSGRGDTTRTHTDNNWHKQCNEKENKNKSGLKRLKTTNQPMITCYGSSCPLKLVAPPLRPARFLLLLSLLLTIAVVVVLIGSSGGCFALVTTRQQTKQQQQHRQQLELSEQKQKQVNQHQSAAAQLKMNKQKQQQKRKLKEKQSMEKEEATNLATRANLEKEKNVGGRAAAVAAATHGSQLDYPNYCWFHGLENRILLEYPEANWALGLLREHDKQLNKERNFLRAAKLHKVIFRKIYQLELEREEEEERKKNNENSSAPELTSESIVDSAQHRAAFKLFDLWANTPGNFEAPPPSLTATETPNKDSKQTKTKLQQQQRAQREFNNYLTPYLVQSQVEFWSYCWDNQSDCDQVLNQLSVLARSGELGPIELLQVSLNIIMLMNSHKADLVLEKLLERKVISLGSSMTNDDEDDDEDETALAYERMLERVVKLIEIDDDFNEATFQYVFSARSSCDSGDTTTTADCLKQSSFIGRMIDEKLEHFLADQLQTRQDG